MIKRALYTYSQKIATGWLSKESILDPSNLWAIRLTLVEGENINHPHSQDGQVLPHMRKPKSEE